MSPRIRNATRRVIVEIRVRAVAGSATQGVDAPRMPVGFLANVERRQRHAERGELPKNIGEPAVCDHVVTGLPQRLRTQTLNVSINSSGVMYAPAGGGGVFGTHRRIDPIPRREQSLCEPRAAPGDTAHSPGLQGR